MTMLWNCSRKILIGFIFFSCCISFNPYFFSLSSASFSVRPFLSVFNSLSASSILLWCIFHCIKSMKYFLCLKKFNFFIEYFNIGISFYLIRTTICALISLFHIIFLLGIEKILIIGKFFLMSIFIEKFPHLLVVHNYFGHFLQSGV